MGGGTDYRTSHGADKLKIIKRRGHIDCYIRKQSIKVQQSRWVTSGQGLDPGSRSGVNSWFIDSLPFSK